MHSTRDFKTDLTSIKLGWSAQAAVQQRAGRILEIEENSAEAYELSIEAEQLQEAEAISFGLGWNEGGHCQEEWLLRRHVWARMAVHGYRVRRSFWMPAGATAEQAAAEARRIYSKGHIGADDVSCSQPITNKIAAE